MKPERIKVHPNAKEAHLSEYVFGKVQPQAVDLECAVLGALMLDKDAFAVVLDILKPDSFYIEAHQEIYRAMLRLFESGAPIDLLTVTQELTKAGKRDEVGGGHYLVELTNRVGSSANVEYHARIVAQQHIKRELIKVSTNVIKEAYDETTDTFSLLENTEKGIFDVTQGGFQRNISSPDGLAVKVLKELEAAKNKPDGLTGVPSGFTDLDRLTSGWQPSDLIILAARPGMGKTSLVLKMAQSAYFVFDKPVAIFSLEMSDTQLVKRVASSHCKIAGSKMRSGKLDDADWQELQSFLEKWNSCKIFIDDTPGISPFELRAKCRRLKMQHDIQMVIIDYIQLMNGKTDKGGNREQEISYISRSLKELAKELNVPVIVLSQLSREVEKRGGSKRPMLSDLRESGAIEQDADIVSFLYRPEYYSILEDESGQSLKGIAELIIAKHRNGALDTVKLRFQEDFATFSDMDEADIFSSQFPEVEPPASVAVRPSKRNDHEDIPF